MTPLPTLVYCCRHIRRRTHSHYKNIYRIQRHKMDHYSHMLLPNLGICLYPNPQRYKYNHYLSHFESAFSIDSSYRRGYMFFYNKLDIKPGIGILLGITSIYI